MNILWDFDGTLFDTYPAYTKMLSLVLGEAVDKQGIYGKLKISYSHAADYYNISSDQKEKIKEKIVSKRYETISWCGRDLKVRR